ncbi:MAG: hypothetical protein IIA88_02315 [Bacteroidetes bacterium]|nr:hypothetical protein [Bacteroidota bacterium]
MAKIDEIKETLNTLRMLFTIISVMFIGIGAGLINMYKENQFNQLFWLGLYTEFIIFVLILTIDIAILQKIIKSGEL